MKREYVDVENSDNSSDDVKSPIKGKFLTSISLMLKSNTANGTSRKPPVAFTVEEARVIVDLKESGTNWAEIGRRVPGRSINSMQVAYPRLKAMVEIFTTADEEKLQQAIADDEKSRWKRIGLIVGKSDVGCRNKAKQKGWSK